MQQIAAAWGAAEENKRGEREKGAQISEDGRGEVHALSMVEEDPKDPKEPKEAQELVARGASQSWLGGGCVVSFPLRRGMRIGCACTMYW